MIPEMQYVDSRSLEMVGYDPTEMSLAMILLSKR